MKNQLICISIALLTLVACKQPVAVEESESPDYAAFDKKVEAISSFYQAHCDEDLEALRAMVSDTMTWNPPYYSDNTLLGKEDYLTALKGYHDAYENIKYTAGIVTPDSIINGFWSGSVFPKENATFSKSVFTINIDFHSILVPTCIHFPSEHLPESFQKSIPSCINFSSDALNDF